MIVIVMVMIVMAMAMIMRMAMVMEWMAMVNTMIMTTNDRLQVSDHTTSRIDLAETRVSPTP